MGLLVPLRYAQERLRERAPQPEPQRAPEAITVLGPGRVWVYPVADMAKAPELLTPQQKLREVVPEAIERYERDCRGVRVFHIPNPLVRD